jgi:hypothetical protein
VAKQDAASLNADSSSPSLMLFNDGSALGYSSWRRAAIAVTITFAPLAILGVLQGVAWGPTRAESVVLDPAMFARFLVALPILILASSTCSTVVNAVARHFQDAGLLKETDRQRYAAIVVSANRLSNSRAAIWTCFGLAYAYSALFVLLVLPRMTISWRTLSSEGHRTLSLAGWWFVTVSQPIYLFVLLRFLYRMALWWQFLWKTSRLNLQLHAVHPDGAGGLGFLGLTLFAFRVPAFAISASFAGGLANLVLVSGARVSDFRYEIVAVVLFVVALFAYPLANFYYRELSRARQRDVLNYWRLNEAQLRQLERKWIVSHSEQADMLSVADFSEVIDLSSILVNAQRMTLLPFQPGAILTLVLAASLPFLPVVALEFPVLQLLKALLKLLA